MFISPIAQVSIKSPLIWSMLEVRPEGLSLCYSVTLTCDPSLLSCILVSNSVCVECLATRIVLTRCRTRAKCVLAAKLYVHLCELRSLVLCILWTGRTAVPNDLQFMVLSALAVLVYCKFAPQFAVLQVHTASSKSEKTKEAKPWWGSSRNHNLSFNKRFVSMFLMLPEARKWVQNKLVRGCSAFRKKKKAHWCRCTCAHVRMWVGQVRE